MEDGLMLHLTFHVSLKCLLLPETAFEQADGKNKIKTDVGLVRHWLVHAGLPGKQMNVIVDKV